MAYGLPTQIPGEKLRKAIDEFSELRNKYPAATREELIDMVAQKFDLSPLETDFLLRHLNSN